MDSLNGRVKDLFGKCSSKKGKFIGSDQIFETIRSDYYKALEDADEKVCLQSTLLTKCFVKVELCKVSCYHFIIMKLNCHNFILLSM